MTIQEVPTVLKSAIIVANPHAGSYDAHALESARRLLQEQDWNVEIQLSEQSGDLFRFAQEAVKQKLDAVIVAGGDGSINEVVQALANSQTALALLPGGTVNVWAREAGIPLDWQGALDVLLHGQEKVMDLGQINDHYFLSMAGVGMDGEIAQAVEGKPAKRLGPLGYVLVGTWKGVGYSGFRAELQLGQKRIKTNALQIVFGNTQLYGGVIKYTWKAHCDDGILDLCIVKKQNFWRRFLVALDFLMSRKERQQWVRYEKVQEVLLSTQQVVAIQVDGEPILQTVPEQPTRVRIVPDALKVIVPQQVPGDLFLH
jgi:YegS/Rv2252/BmrU family lipid kinase